jgi:hypothetical protein
MNCPRKKICKIESAFTMIGGNVADSTVPFAVFGPGG